MPRIVLVVQEEVDLIMVLVVKVQIAILTLQAIMHNNRQKRDILFGGDKNSGFGKPSNSGFGMNSNFDTGDILGGSSNNTSSNNNNSNYSGFGSGSNCNISLIN